MKITYIQHSGFMVEFRECALIFDFYKGTLPSIRQDKKIYVFASHNHQDHFQEKIFNWQEIYPQIQYILSDDIQAEPAGNRVFIGPEKDLELEHIRIKTLRSTDEGVAFFVSVREGTGGQAVNIYHAGDLNWWHWEEEGPAYNREMEKNFKQALSPIEGAHIDAAFIPVDPRLENAYYWGIDWFMRHTDTALVYPMHLWRRYQVIDKLMEQPETKDYRDRIARLEKEDEGACHSGNDMIECENVRI